mmetsp:Transcript_38026/g.114956  ORF Transcript_38026/g.114956 Transcript_38026/m.114956 type:complete len:276 (+) Transcript_38026:232-1059(+)
MARAVTPRHPRIIIHPIPRRSHSIARCGSHRTFTLMTRQGRATSATRAKMEGAHGSARRPSALWGGPSTRPAGTAPGPRRSGACRPRQGTATACSRGRSEASPLATGPGGTTPAAMGTSGPSCTIGAGTTFLTPRVVSRKATPPPGTGREHADRWRKGRRIRFSCKMFDGGATAPCQQPKLGVMPGYCFGPSSRVLLRVLTCRITCCRLCHPSKSLFCHFAFIALRKGTPIIRSGRCRETTAPPLAWSLFVFGGGVLLLALLFSAHRVSTHRASR